MEEAKGAMTVAGRVAKAERVGVLDVAPAAHEPELAGVADRLVGYGERAQAAGDVRRLHDGSEVAARPASQLEGFVLYGGGARVHAAVGGDAHALDPGVGEIHPASRSAVHSGA